MGPYSTSAAPRVCLPPFPTLRLCRHPDSTRPRPDSRISGSLVKRHFVTNITYLISLPSTTTIDPINGWLYWAEGSRGGLRILSVCNVASRLTLTCLVRFFFSTIETRAFPRIWISGDARKERSDIMLHSALLLITCSLNKLDRPAPRVTTARSQDCLRCALVIRGASSDRHAALCLRIVHMVSKTSEKNDTSFS